MQFSALACGALTLGWLAYTTYVALACYAAFYGAFVGIFVVLIGPISADLFPIEQVRNGSRSSKVLLCDVM